MPPQGPPRRLQDEIPKPKTIKEVPSYLLKKAKLFFEHLFYVVKLMWESAPFLLILMVLLCILDGVLPVFSAYVSRDLLNAIAALLTQHIALPDSFSGVVAVFSGVLWLFFFEFLLTFLRRVVSRLDGVVSTLAGELVSNHIKMMIIRKAKTVDQSSFDRPEFYEKLENANREAGMRPIGIITSTFSVVSASISVVSFIVVLGGLSPWAPVLMILASLPTAAVNYIYRNRNFWYLRRHSKERRELNYYASVLTNKDLVKEVKVLSLGDTFIHKYENVFVRYFKGIRSLVVREGVTQTIVSLVTSLVNFALFAYIAYNVVFNDGQIGDYSLYTGALTSIAGYVTTFVNATARIYEGTLFVDNMMTFMEEEPKIVSLLPEGRTIEVGREHTLELRGVCFSYPGSEREVIRDVNLTLRSGESTVLVGLNGAGKTTLIKLIMRLYDPTRGEILLDGRDIREYEPEAYYNLFGIIFQDFAKFAVSARENIEFGDVGSAHSEERVAQACRDGGAAEFVEDLPQKLDTPLTRMFEDDGIELSGGQWQKLSIARAFYKNSDILILDEPTASLDPLAEADVFERFTTLSEGKIAIFISHRLSGAVEADNIIVLEHGTIVEHGSHAELMAQGGKYFHLFSTQAKRYTGIDYDAHSTEDSGMDEGVSEA
ncbi:MAG: ABC transporter ATP-binding protein [Clostridia bacterium]|nr:ABC transporter ATP-binding protein [Clostridia bacterium]